MPHISTTRRSVEDLIVATTFITSEHIHTASQGINLLLNHHGGSGDGGVTSTSGGGAGESRGISEVSLEGLGLVEGKGLQANHNSDASLEGVADRVGDGGLSGVAQLKGNGSHSIKSLGESGNDHVLVDGQHGGREDGAVIVHRLDHQTVGKGADSKLGEQGSLGSTDLVASLDQLHSGSDLNLTLLNLGGDLEDLEKGGLSRVTTGGTGGHHDIARGNGTGTSRGGNSVGKNDVLDLTEVIVGEHHTDVAVDLLIDGTDGVARVLLHEVLEHLTDEGVLSHQDLGLTAHLVTGLVHLLRADIVNLHEEHLVVGGQKRGQSLNVEFLLGFGERHLLEFQWGLITYE
mmetsp:Transcript_17151/g.28675  ORF Transcript_17151/g.28675 Transcript_17151/m.28675 type:complete len:346 (+) Transcript_17151:87-1124(+)